MKSKNDVEDRRVSAVFIIAICGVCLLSAVTPDAPFSLRENRYLQGKPRLTLHGLLSGRFMADLEEYLIDQFPGRDSWVFLKSGLDLLMGRRENKGVYLSEDWLLPRCRLDLNLLERNAHYVRGFLKGTGLPGHLVLVPSATAVYPERLPPGAPSDDERDALEAARKVFDGEGCSVRVVDFWGDLEAAKDEAIYFRTDHHWTMRGAYCAYSRWMQCRGEAPVPVDEFDRCIVSTDFLGTHYSKANPLSITPDYIEVFYPPGAGDVQVSLPQSLGKQGSLFDSTYLEGRDQYGYFLGGSHPVATIETGANDGGSLLVIKDSYAHAFVPFLVPHFKSIHVLDLRYYGGSPQDYARQGAFDEVLFLFGTSSFCSNSNFHRLGF